MTGSKDLDDTGLLGSNLKLAHFYGILRFSVPPATAIIWKQGGDTAGIVKKYDIQEIQM